MKTWIPNNQKKILNLVLKKRKDFFWLFSKYFFENLIIVWSFDSQLQLSCQQIYCLHEISFHFWINRYIFRYKSMKSGKTSKIVKRNECVIDFYRLINTIDINQIRFTDFYRLTTPGDTTIRCTQTYNHFTATTFSVFRR